MASPSSRRERTDSQPPGNTGTHIPAPNTYLLAQLTRANYLTARRYPFTDKPDAFATELQRYVHHEGNRPPNRRILLFLRLLTFYPPVPDILPELVMLLESHNHHVCRLAHHHIRQLAPIRDSDSYRQLISALERQASSPAPARRACATKTLAKVFRPSDTAHVTDFVLEVFNKIGGARVCRPVAPVKPKRMDGVSTSDGTAQKEKQTNMDKFRERTNAVFAPSKIVRGEVYDYKKVAMEAAGPSASPSDPRSSNRNMLRRNSAAAQTDDGAGGTIQASSAATAQFVRSRLGKIVVCHATLAALRRINRVATDQARVESYIFDSGLVSMVQSVLRHSMALLELRSTVSPKAVSQYLAPRLPHRGPPPDMRLQLEDLGARVYFTRLVSSLAEDPNLSQYIPDEAPKQAKRDANNTRNKIGATMAEGATVREKATQLFKFLFSREQVNNIVSSVRNTASNALVVAKGRPPKAFKQEDSLGVEYAEALINLVKNASNRVLIEALRGLSRRKWTTWFEAPIPQSALYNAPELRDADAGNTADDIWGDEDSDDDTKGDSEDENELGAYEDDMAKGGGQENESEQQERRASSVKGDGKEPDIIEDRHDTTEKETLFSRMKVRRRERRENRIDGKTPFYLRTMQEGMVPALEIILRRINAALLEDEPVRRFAAVDAVIVLSRAKIYGHTEEEHLKLRQAQQAMGRLQIKGVGASSSSDAAPLGGGSFGDEKTHPLEALVKPLLELIDEDPNAFIRGRSAVALLFVVASGAGRGELNDESQAKLGGDMQPDVDEDMTNPEEPILLRMLGNYVRHPASGNGVGLKQMSEVVDYMVYEVLDIAPELAPSALALAEEWARVHPTVGVCGRLGAIWEKVLSLGLGKLVGESLIRSISSGPALERVASAATIFLRRRTLDVAALTVGAEKLGVEMTSGVGLPEPLPTAVGIEMEKYFSVLWHCILLGPSAECRAFAVESLGGASVLAGEPFRISTYERLVELVRVGGLGVRPIIERVLTSLDTLYVVREQFSETRAKYRIARDGSYRGKEWLAIVWKLRCDAVNAAQIVLGVEPPAGWLALGPGAAKDVANAEKAAEQTGTNGLASVNVSGMDIGSGGGGDSSNGHQQALLIGNGMQQNQTGDGRMGGVTVGTGNGIDSDLPAFAMPVALLGDGRNDDGGPASHGSHSGGRRGRRRYDNERSEYDRYRHREQGHEQYNENERHQRRQYYDHDHDYERYGDRDGEYGYDDRGRERERERRRYDEREQRERYDEDDEIQPDRHKQEEEDRKLAERMQKEEQGGGDGLFADGQGGGGGGGGTGAGLAADAKDMLSSTAEAAGRLWKQGLKGGKGLTDKVRKTAARSAALDSLRNRM